MVWPNLSRSSMMFIFPQDLVNGPYVQCDWDTISYPFLDASVKQYRGWMVPARPLHGTRFYSYSTVEKRTKCTSQPWENLIPWSGGIFLILRLWHHTTISWTAVLVSVQNMQCLDCQPVTLAPTVMLTTWQEPSLSWIVSNSNPKNTRVVPESVFSTMTGIPRYSHTEKNYSLFFVC